MQETWNQKTKRHIKHKKHNDRSKSLLTSNYFKCKWIKLSNQKTEIDRMNKKPYDPTICSLQETHLRSKDTNRLKEKDIP